MRIIDLLNKIANGEEVPKKIKWGELILEWEELGFHDYKFLETGNHFLFHGFTTSVLNDEVEVIEEDKKDNFTGWKMYQDGREVCSMDCSQEEDKKIEKLQYSKLEVCPDLESLLEFVNESREEFRRKINEIIKRL